MDEETLLELGYRKYRGAEVDIYFNTNVCEHSGNCVKGNAELFNLDRKPWIMPDNVSKEEAKRVIHTCPSGALQYIEK
ncbi:(4Fe-4S)-binding protein [Listeria monocytogenes]|uniref:Divergent 4Fe-4S mono-cluster domain-containing protein n=2 Tax=Listeria monocytogenes TaxID=1639 RepID=A0A3T2CQV0_LISMN|nr:(4Fe-4S)-binding protein [Listeria monocytogenes]EAA0165412.1 hypothetical protein [Listeria monocytogenes serotype 1/2a]EHC6211045.1 hypothetical protein [Listeria monocytogenes serotype 1/2b]AEO02208.1 hypothetical protein LMOG_01479 [Listeria monocytogenes J0161]AKI48105.1 hypothetical protein L2625_00131 [Listeria monocytogenes]AQP63817.1 hypothetical protein B0X19_00700 [Listeria monocytogenes]